MIAAIQQVGNNVRVLNEKGLTLFMKCGECVGYTADTIILYGVMIQVEDVCLENKYQNLPM